MALHWTLFSSSPSFLNWGAHHWTQHSRCDLTRAEQRGRTTSLDLLATHFLPPPSAPFQKQFLYPLKFCSKALSFKKTTTFPTPRALPELRAPAAPLTVPNCFTFWAHFLQMVFVLLKTRPTSAGLRTSTPPNPRGAHGSTEMPPPRSGVKGVCLCAHPPPRQPQQGPGAALPLLLELRAAVRALDDGMGDAALLRENSGHVPPAAPPAPQRPSAPLTRRRPTQVSAAARLPPAPAAPPAPCTAAAPARAPRTGTAGCTWCRRTEPGLPPPPSAPLPAGRSRAGPREGMREVRGEARAEEPPAPPLPLPPPCPGAPPPPRAALGPARRRRVAPPPPCVGVGVTPRPPPFPPPRAQGSRGSQSPPRAKPAFKTRRPIAAPAPPGAANPDADAPPCAARRLGGPRVAALVGPTWEILTF